MPRTDIVRWHDLCGIVTHYGNRQRPAARGGTAMRDGLRRRLGVVAAGAALGRRGAVALVSGGSRGLGLALSWELAREGCRLAICARDESELQAARADLEQS